MEMKLENHVVECDVLVAGGGMSGVCSALAAAREGARVVLCQDRPVLGGNASSEIRMHIVGANSSRPQEALLLEARESGLIEEIRLENAYRNPQGSPSVFDLILYEKCRAEKNLQLYFNTSVVSAKRVGNRVEEVQAISPSTEQSYTIRAKVFIDATGDGGLGVAVDAAAMRGREDKEAFGESLAREVADHKTLGSTILFMGKKHDKPMRFVAPPWARKFTEEDLKLRKHALVGVDSGLEYGYWWIEWGGQLDTIKDNELIRDELLAIVMGIWDHIKNDGDHGADEWSLDWFGVVPGKRESRRFIGQYILNENDVMGSHEFGDAIAYGGWPIDLHPPEGVDCPDEPPCTQTKVPYLYDIPLRCCVARDLENLMFAGRNISATHVAFASTRVMATCALVGQGVGTAAAYAVKNGMAPQNLAADPMAMHAIQQRLLQADVYLIGKPHSQEGNLVRTAKLEASSVQPEGAVENILSGQNRSVHHPERGVPQERALPGTHRWMSDPKDGLPAWLQFTWDTAQTIQEISLVFDSGLHRFLTLSHSAEYMKQMIWDQGQPEMVKSYSLEVLREEGWQQVTTVAENWNRQVTHTIPPALQQGCLAVRLNITASWGVEHARVISAWIQ